MFLCCYVVKLGKAKKQKPKKTPPKKWKYFRVFFTRQVMVACAKVIAFFGCFVVFSLLLKKHYKNGVFDDFEMLIFSFFGQKSRVNNLATVGSITWPHVCKNFGKMWPVIDPTVFTCFFVQTCFFSKNLILPAERRIFLKKQKNKTKTIKKGGQVIDSWWPSYY